MALTKNQKIAVYSTVLLAAVSIWVTMYTHSPDLIHNEFQPPDHISANKMSNDFYFEIGNYGQKTGSYYLTLTSNDESLDFKKGFNGDYQSELGFGYSLPPNDVDSCFLYMKQNDSYIPQNLNFVFSVTDRSGIVHKTERYTSYYDFDSESNRYIYNNTEYHWSRSIF